MENFLDSIESLITECKKDLKSRFFFSFGWKVLPLSERMKMMDFLKKLWHTIGHYKYQVTILLFVLIVCFLDKNNLFVRMRNKQEINRLNAQIEYYSTLVDSLENELDALEQGGDALEAIAREQYGMHKEDEEVFIIK